MKTSVFLNISELVTLEKGAQKEGRRPREEDLSLIRQAAIVAQQGRIVWVGPQKQLSSQWLKLPGSKSQKKKKNDLQEFDLEKRVVIPGLVECHTHLIFSGHRWADFEKRNQGVSYQDVVAQGGGIQHTVNNTRKATSSELFKLGALRVQNFVRQGVTTLEVKSGYGLDQSSEMKILKVAGRLTGPRVIRTFLGPHSCPQEFQSCDEYLDFLIDQVLPKVARQKLAERLDIFVESGFFTLKHLHRWFEAGRKLNLGLVAHVDQLSAGGSAQVAQALGAQSVDHAVHLSSEEIQALAKSSTTVVLLPTSDFYLKVSYPKARDLLAAGARVALATDFNPGTSPTQDLSFVGVLARLEMKMTLPEVIMAYTVGAAWALGLGHHVGALTHGRQCDLAVLDGDWRELFYQVGHHPVRDVFRAGEKLS